VESVLQLIKVVLAFKAICCFSHEDSSVLIELLHLCPQAKAHQPEVPIRVQNNPSPENAMENHSKPQICFLNG
jgi:hypothetical protein